MPAPFPIRTARDAAELRGPARREHDGRVGARLRALANALDGLPRERAAELAGMTGQTLGDWVHRYNAEGVAGLRDRPRPGRPGALDERRQAALKDLILRGPRLERDGCVASRVGDLCALAERRFGVRYGESGMARLMKRLDLSRQKARPVHPEADQKARERFKNPARADPRGCRSAPRGGAGGALVRGRGPGRAERARYPRLVPERGAPTRGARAPLRLGPPVRRGLPGAGRRRRAGPARGLDQGHGPVPGRAGAGGAGRRARRARPRPGGVARERGPGRASEPDPGPPAAVQSRAQPGRASLAPPARAVAEPPRPRGRLQGGRGRRLRGLERAHRRARPPLLANQLPLAAPVRANFVRPVLDEFPWYRATGAELELARTVAVNTLVFGELLY